MSILKIILNLACNSVLWESNMESFYNYVQCIKVNLYNNYILSVPSETINRSTIMV